MKLEKAIQELDKEINLYATLGFDRNNKKEELFELLGWRNFLQYATGISEKERMQKLQESNVLYTHIYILPT